MDFFGWIRLLVKNRFAVDLRRIPVVFLITVFSLGNLPLRLLKKIIFGWRISKIQIENPPLFILGTARTGTTLLHELLSRDPRHNYPSNLACFNSNHFLLTKNIIILFSKLGENAKRPQDNMKIGLNSPQEDEFALERLGIPSPYSVYAFPNHGKIFSEYYDLEELSPKKKARWGKSLLHFLKELSYKNSRRIILKTPLHSYRIKTLLELFPQAKFVEMVRNPYAAFPSWVHTHKSLCEKYSFQKPNFQDWELEAMDNLSERIKKIGKGKALVDSQRYYQLKYEDLIQDPVKELRALYQHLDLEDFEEARPGIEGYLEETKSYQKNVYDLSPELEAKITRNFSFYLKAHGYEPRLSQSKKTV